MLKKIESEDKTKFNNFCLSSKAGVVINESDIDDMLESIYTTNIAKHTKIFRKRFRVDY